MNNAQSRIQTISVYIAVIFLVIIAAGLLALVTWLWKVALG